MPIAVRAKPALIKPAPLAVPTSGGLRAPRSFKLEAESELGEVMKQVSAAMGKEVARFASDTNGMEIRIPTGTFPLDLALAGGFQISRGSMLYGERSSGKSTTALRAAVHAQQMFPDQVVVYIDLEGTFDPRWFVKLGGDLTRLLKVEPESGEHAVDVADAMFRSKETSMLITDSIAMLVPMKEIEQSAEDNMMGVHARLTGNYLRRLNNAMLKERHRGHNPLVLHLNQFRMKIVAFGDPRSLPGGKALEFCTSQQVEMKNKEIVDENSGDVKWNEHSFKITKDKTGGRIREGKFKMTRTPEWNTIKGTNIQLPEGYIDCIKTVIAAADRIGMVQGQLEIAGFGKQRGADAWQEYFFKNPEAYVACQRKVIAGFRDKWGLPNV